MKKGALSGRRNVKGPFSASASRPNTSLVKVESIFINIDAAEQIKPEICEHFTIRGFVSDRREENGKLHWPISVDGEGARCEEINSTLYPLHTPQSKSWRCQGCLNEIDVTAAGAKKDSQDIYIKCSEQLKAINYRSHRSLENVLAYLSKKSKQLSELGGPLCEGIKSASKFKQKQKKKLDSAFHSKNRGRGENVLHKAANGLTSNQQESLTYVSKQQTESLRLPTRTTPTKSVVVEGSQHKRMQGSTTKLVQSQHDDSICNGRRKTKAKKVRLLNEILKKDGKGRKGNNNCQEQDRKWYPMHFANSVDGNCEGNKTQGVNSTFTNAMHLSSNDGHSGAVNGNMNYADRSQKTNEDSCGRQVHLPNCQPFNGRPTDSSNNNLPHSQLRGESNDSIHTVNRGANLPAPSDNEGNNVTHKLIETIQIGHQAEYFQPLQEGSSSRKHHSFAEGGLGAIKSTGDWIPSTGYRNSKYGSVVYMGESSTTHKSLVDKFMHQGTSSISVLKRSNQGPCGGNKKPKHGPTVVHQTEFLLTNSNKTCGVLDKPENTLYGMRGKMQEVGTSDDIPMEIVELMAKNQYERHLHEIGDKRHLQQSVSYPENDLLDSSSMLPNEVSQGPLHGSPHLANTWLISGEKSGISNGKSNGHIMQQLSTGSNHRPLLSNQQVPAAVLPFPVVSSSKTDIYPIQTCKYDMNELGSEKIVHSRSHAQFVLWEPTSQQSKKIDRAWPMMLPNIPVHNPCVLQGNALHSYNAGKASNCSNYADEGRDFSTLARTGKKTKIFIPKASHTSYPNGGDSRPRVMGSPDPYANEAIPAMHLLSLLNDRPQTSTLSNMDAVANRKTFDRSFTNDHLSKELSRNSFSVGKLSDSSHTLKQLSPYGYHKNPQSDASCQCSPPIPTFGSAVASLHGDVGDKKGVRPSSNHHERAFQNVNPGAFLTPSENKSLKNQKFRVNTPVGVEFQQLIPAHELANCFRSPLRSVPSSSDLHINGNLYRYRNSVSHESYDTSNKHGEPRVCYLNRNPMEFTTPGPGNEFMIGREELKLRRMYPPIVTGPMSTNSFKQLGFMKYASPNKRL